MTVRLYWNVGSCKSARIGHIRPTFHGRRTYKYALLVAPVVLAIERGDDSNRELALPIHCIAGQSAELYW